ncbi:hypothetical protein [Spiroplasma endosymbiont of Acasis viretata]|uniref:hypothetical protein n=1 Tax=Spiroplasma endosymbiont of Acasis viretata TaxID=3066306 RepID=UPI00313DDA05
MGIKLQTFQKMVEILKKAEAIKKAVGGKPNKLSIENRLLMTLNTEKSIVVIELLQKDIILVILAAFVIFFELKIL